MFIGVEDSEKSARQFVDRAFHVMSNAMDASYSDDIKQETFTYIMNEAYDSGFTYQTLKFVNNLAQKALAIGALSSIKEDKSLFDRVEDFFFG